MSSFAALTPAFLLHKADEALSEGDARALGRLLHAVEERDVSGEQTRPALLLAKNVLGVLVGALDARPPPPAVDDDGSGDEADGRESRARGRRVSPARPGPTARATRPDPAAPRSFDDADELVPTSVHSFGDENARPDDALSLEDLRQKCDDLIKRNVRLEGDLKAAMKELGAARMRKKAEGVPMDLRSTKHLEEELRKAKESLAEALEDGARTKKELAEVLEFAKTREAERVEQVRRLAREGANVAKKELEDDVADAAKRAGKRTEEANDLAARAAAGVREALAVNAMLERRLIKERDARIKGEAAAAAATRVLAFKRIVQHQMHYMAKDGAMPLDPPLDNPGLLDELHVAATIIQKRIRGVLGRKAARRLCEEIIVEEYEEFTRMERAATSVQATFRGHVVRKDVAKARGERYSAAVKLQTKYRGHKARKEFREMRRETVEAATTVQSRFRGFQARKGHERRVEARKGEIAAFVADCIARVVEAAAMEEHEAAVSALERPGEEGPVNDFARRSAEFDFASRSSEFDAWATAKETA